MLKCKIAFYFNKICLDVFKFVNKISLNLIKYNVYFNFISLSILAVKHFIILANIF
jgi:hypothetical protein